MPIHSLHHAAEDAAHAINHGHYSRLQSRLLTSMHETLSDDEVLEILLSYAYPEKDVSLLARTLMHQFGTLAKILSADPNLLRTVPGINDTALASLRIVHEAACRLTREASHATPIFQSWKALLDYCRVAMGHLSYEQIRVLFLNNSYHLITDELHSDGTVDHVALYPRNILKRALLLDASFVILIHNHPSGNPKPSSSDIDMTRSLEETLRGVGLILLDHLIIAGKKHYSFKNEGILG